MTDLIDERIAAASSATGFLSLEARASALRPPGDKKTADDRVTEGMADTEVILVASCMRSLSEYKALAGLVAFVGLVLLASAPRRSAPDNAEARMAS